MPGMTSAPRKGRRDFEPANCLNEIGADCTRVRAQRCALWMGSNSHDALWSRQLQGLWLARAIADEPYD